MTKLDQLKKVKRVNTRKMSKVELQLYKDFIFDLADGLCQCGCGKEISTYHHSSRGAYKSDESLTGINHECHNTLHFSTDTHEREALTILFKSVGMENWKEYSA